MNLTKTLATTQQAADCNLCAEKTTFLISFFQNLLKKLLHGVNVIFEELFTSVNSTGAWFCRLGCFGTNHPKPHTHPMTSDNLRQGAGEGTCRCKMGVRHLCDSVTNLNPQCITAHLLKFRSFWACANSDPISSNQASF